MKFTHIVRSLCFSLRVESSSNTLFLKCSSIFKDVLNWNHKIWVEQLKGKQFPTYILPLQRSNFQSLVNTAREEDRELWGHSLHAYINLGCSLFVHLLLYCYYSSLSDHTSTSVGYNVVTRAPWLSVRRYTIHMTTLFPWYAFDMITTHWEVPPASWCRILHSRTRWITNVEGFNISAMTAKSRFSIKHARGSYEMHKPSASTRMYPNWTLLLSTKV